eukprot:12641280-Alexandrium_andersonii.AAC.1
MSTSGCWRHAWLCVPRPAVSGTCQRNSRQELDSAAAVFGSQLFARLLAVEDEREGGGDQTVDRTAVSPTCTRPSAVQPLRREG